MINEFEIRLVTNHTTCEMYANSSSSSELVSVPNDGAVQYLQGNPGLKIPLAGTAESFSSQSFPTLCMRDDSDSSNPWLVWSYFFTESSSGSGTGLMTHYNLYEIHYTSVDLPDSSDTSSRYNQGVLIASIGGLDSHIDEVSGLHLPNEFGVRGITVDESGTPTQRMGIWVIGDISTGIIQL